MNGSPFNRNSQETVSLSSRRCHALSILGDCDHMSTGSEQQRGQLARLGSKRDVLQDLRRRAFYLSLRATRELVISSIESNASYSRTEEACTASIKPVLEERNNTRGVKGCLVLDTGVLGTLCSHTELPFTARSAFRLGFRRVHFRSNSWHSL